MIQFDYAKLSDKPWVDELLSNVHYMGCEYCFGNLFIWRRPNKLEIARVDDFVTAYSEKHKFYLYPAGKGDLERAILKIAQDAEERGFPLTFYAVSEDTKEELERIMPGRFSFKPYRDGFDYIYNSSDLINLAGKKYHGKRNHIARFKDNHAYEYQSITRENISDCFAMSEKWCIQNDCGSRRDLQKESMAISEALNHFEELGFTGGLIRVDGEVAAFTVGEPINDEVFCVHIEKAYSCMQGAYPMINNLFVKNAAEGYRYINREEDMGSEGLRKAKQSYRPAILLTKYFARLRK